MFFFPYRLCRFSLWDSLGSRYECCSPGYIKTVESRLSRDVSFEAFDLQTATSLLRSNGMLLVDLIMNQAVPNESGSLLVAFCPEWIVLKVGWTLGTGHFARRWQHHQVRGPLWCFFASFALWYQSVFRGGNPLGDVSSGFCQALVRQLPAFQRWCWHGLCCACMLWPECLYPLQGGTASDQGGRATSPYLLLSIVSGGRSRGCTSRATALPVVTHRP